MINFIPTPFALIARLLHDAAESAADATTAQNAHCEPYLSDDATDDLDASCSIISYCMTALFDDERDAHCAELLDTIINCHELPDGTECTHMLSIDFDSPIFHIMPDWEECPNMND